MGVVDGWLRFLRTVGVVGVRLRLLVSMGVVDDLKAVRLCVVAVLGSCPRRWFKISVAPNNTFFFSLSLFGLVFLEVSCFVLFSYTFKSINFVPLNLALFLIFLFLFLFFYIKGSRSRQKKKIENLINKGPLLAAPLFLNYATDEG